MTEIRERSPQFYARVAGCIYLVAMAVSIFSQSYVLGRIVVPGSAAATAANLAQSGGLFRLGIALDVVTFVSDVVIAWAFYGLLRSVYRALALLGAWLRIADAAILAVTTVRGLVTLRLLSGADDLQAFSSEQLQTLARLFIGIRGLGFGVGFVFLGLGSAVFAYVLYRSRYVPRALAGWGIGASLLLALGSLAEMLSPWFSANVGIMYMLPMFFYEVPLGAWFLLRGVSVPPVTAAAGR